MDIFQAFINLAYKQFGEQGFTVLSATFGQEIQFNLQFQNIFFIIFYDRQRKIWRYQQTHMTVVELYNFLKTIRANYTFYTTMKVYLENLTFRQPSNGVGIKSQIWPGLMVTQDSDIPEPLVQLKVGNFLINDTHPAIRFYYKEMYWMLDKNENSFDLYEFYNRKPIPHLTGVSFKTIDRFIQKI